VFRIVLDTNVFISAYGFGGKPLRLLQSAVVGEYRLVTSVPIMTELADKLYTVLEWDDEHVAAALKQIARVAEIVEPSQRIALVADDADNRVLEAAVEGQADLIATGDNHLLDLRDHDGIRILKPADVLDLIAS
jgi:putative PIN family toxin of toxin-antitoxin system